MSAPSSRRPPASTRLASSRRSTRGGAAGMVPAVIAAAPVLAGVPAGSPASRASSRATRPASSGARPGGGMRMATRSTTPPEPERDRFLASVGALRDWLAYLGRDATWRIALASVFGCASTQVPLPNDTALARGLLFVGAVTIGALVGKRLDRRKRRSRDGRAR
jgi:hypothetical protein